MNDMNDPHILAADDVLSVLAMHEDRDGAFADVLDAGVRPIHMPTPEHRAAFDALLDLHARGEVVTDVTWLERCKSVATLQDISNWRALYDQTRTGPAYRKSLDIVKRHGTAKGISELLHTTASAITSENFVQSRDSLMQVLTGLDLNQIKVRVKADEIATDFEAFMNSEPPKATSTGLPWLDAQTLGYDPANVWAIVAPYKMRKTTVLLNLLLHAALMGAIQNQPGVAMLSREMTRKEISAILVAMLAVAYMRNKGTAHKSIQMPSGEPMRMDNISGKMLLRSGARYLKWEPDRVEAVNWGIATLKKLGNHLRIYDTTPGGTGLDDVDSALRVMRLDHTRHNGQIMMLDYFQLFGDKSRDGQKLSEYAAKEMQRITKELGLTTLIAAQQNESAVKGEYAGMHSPGVKGGGDLPQVVDYLMSSKYNDETDTPELTLSMKLSRHSQGKQTETFAIHPQSGLLSDMTWLKDQRVWNL
jgi:replicative DNA helicase